LKLMDLIMLDIYASFKESKEINWYL
jgi:hypothetical protein